MTRVKIIGAIVIILTVIASAVTIRVQHGKIQTLTRDLDQMHIVADENKHAAETYINLHGREVNKSHVLELSLRNARALQQSQQLSFVREFTGIKKNLSNLQAAYQYQAQILQSLKLPTRDTLIVYQGDTVKAHAFGYVDQYNEIRGYTTADTTNLTKVKIDVPLQGVFYEGRRTKRFLFFRYGPKELFSEVTSDNPWVKIKDPQFVKIQSK